MSENMNSTFKTPGVYIEEASARHSSIAQVETAIPAFIGFTQLVSHYGPSLINRPIRISSLTEYENIFGLPAIVTFTNQKKPGKGIKIVKDDMGNFVPAAPVHDPFDQLQFRMHYCLQLYFANGGGPCYVVSCGGYQDATDYTAMETSLNILARENQPSMVVFTDAANLPKQQYYSLFQKALAQAGQLRDRFVIIDLLPDLSNKQAVNDFKDGKQIITYRTGEKSLAESFREGIGGANLSYGAAYFPWLKTTIPYFIDESQILVECKFSPLNKVRVLKKKTEAGQKNVDHPEESLYHSNRKVYDLIKKQLNSFTVILPPSAALAGIYSQVDKERGVWKAPANIALQWVKKTMSNIRNDQQDDMNITPSGKSINAIRFFAGRGILVWGSRTLAGNDNEWRYISIRRLEIMIRQSITQTLETLVFEPNDANTWNRIRTMTDNFLMTLWRNGALHGIKPEQAFFVRIGLGQTMTETDMQQGQMILELGIAPIRPSEFIILRITQKLKEVR
jgi:uncharacterized protein